MYDARSGEMAVRLQASSIRLLRLARRDGQAGDLSGPKLSALSFVALAGPVSLGELAAAEQVRPPTMTRLVDRMLEENLVTREVDPKDRRIIRIAVTEEGRRLIEQARPQGEGGLAARLHCLADSERRAIARAVELLERVTRT
nr:MarR family transcriptional regulator [uncultured Sphingosinicella sp.]